MEVDSQNLTKKAKREHGDVSGGSPSSASPTPIPTPMTSAPPTPTIPAPETDEEMSQSEPTDSDDQNRSICDGVTFEPDWGGEVSNSVSAPMTPTVDALASDAETSKSPSPEPIRRHRKKATSESPPPIARIRDVVLHPGEAAAEDINTLKAIDTIIQRYICILLHKLVSFCEFRHSHTYTHIYTHKQ